MKDDFKKLIQRELMRPRITEERESLLISTISTMDSNLGSSHRSRQAPYMCLDLTGPLSSPSS